MKDALEKALIVALAIVAVVCAVALYLFSVVAVIALAALPFFLAYKFLVWIL